MVTTSRSELWVHDSGGDGEPIFLLGGFTAGHFVFDLIRPYFTDYRLLTWEPCGLGPSRNRPDTREPLGAERWAADLAELLDALELAPCRLWATGFGSYIAYALAVAAPDRVRALAAYTDVWAGDETKVYARIWAVYKAIVENFGTRDFGARVLANVFDVSGLPWFGRWEAANIEEVLHAETVNTTVGYCCLHADVRDGLDRIRAPVLVLQGALGWDGRVVEESEDASLATLRAAIPQLEISNIPQAHPAYVLVQQPQRCADAVRAFFAAH